MKLKLRDVETTDIDLLFKWANDSTVRQNAFNTEPIPYENHKMWFVKMLADKDVQQYILCNDNTPLGQIRLNIEDNKAVIDYSIDKEWRGLGLGAKMVLMAEEVLKIKITDVIYCVAQVKYENAASARVFEKCGYDADNQEKYIEFTKRIR